MENHLGFEIVHLTEMAAVAAARTMGCGDREMSDRRAAETLRKEFAKLKIRAKVVIGEGERDEAPMLFVGEELGNYLNNEKLPQLDVAVDPLENTDAVAHGTSGAISALAVSEQGGLLNAPDVYMDKLIVGATARGAIDITRSPKENIKAIAAAYDRHAEEITVAILDRDRHHALIEEVRATGARIKLIPDGDLSAGIAAAVRGTGVHAVMGIGGAPEGVLTAAALRCLNGEMQARLMAFNPDHEKRLRQHGITDLERVYHTEDLAAGERILFSATGVTNGDLLEGVRLFHGGARTQTLVMGSASMKIRFVDTIHVFDRDEVRITFR